MNKKRKLLIASLLTGISILTISGCAFPGGTNSANEAAETSAASDNIKETSATEAPKISGLEFERELPIEFSNFLSIDSYKNGYYVIKTHKGDFFQQLLVVPKDQSVPDGLDSSIVVVQQPIEKSKIDSLSLLDLLGYIDQTFLDKVSLIAADKDSVIIDRVRNNMENGITKNAGSTKNQDLNLLKETNPQLYICNAGLEKEDIYKQIQELGLTPFVSFLHGESEPLARIEWIKMLGTIYGNTEAAEKFFNEQKSVADSIDKSKAEGKTYAMICLRKKDNKVFVRRTGDPIAKIGELAGGKNMLSNINNGSWQEYNLDEFISNFKDTDYIIYLDGHGDKITNKEEFLSVSEKLSELKAAAEDNLWRTKTDYLQMNNVGDIAKELNGIFTDDREIINNLVNFIKIN